MVHQQAIKIRRESRTSFITKAILYQRVSLIIHVLFDRKPWVHAVQVSNSFIVVRNTVQLIKEPYHSILSHIFGK